jgi:hypothetical protein
MIKDSGYRRCFESGAVRDMSGKGRCDLLPLDIVSVLLKDRCYGGSDGEIIECIAEYQQTDDIERLYDVVEMFVRDRYDGDLETALLEVSQHFEQGAEKYGEYNWQKGIPESSYIDSAVRHYLKRLRGDSDEPHDRAFLWNILCLMWTHEHITAPLPLKKSCVAMDCYYNVDAGCSNDKATAEDTVKAEDCKFYSED